MRPPLRSVTLLLGVLAAAPAGAQRVVPSAAVDSTETLFVVLRPGAVLPPTLAERVPASRFLAVVVGYRADSVLLRSFHWRSVGAPAAPGRAPGEDNRMRGAGAPETLAIPALAIDHLEVRRQSALAQRFDSGSEGAFWAAIVGAAIGGLLDGEALRGAGIGAAIGFVGGAASPDRNHGVRWQRVTLRVVPEPGAREP